MKERSGEEAGLSLVAAATFDEQISGKGVVVGSVVTVVGGVVVVEGGGGGQERSAEEASTTAAPYWPSVPPSDC